MNTEYATTTGVWHWEPQHYGHSKEIIAEDPRPPDGDGWVLIGTAVADGALFWTWRRDGDR